MTIGEKISLLRRNRGMTQAKLAEKLSFTRQAIQKWETGQTTPDIYMAPQIAKLFNISVNTLLDPNISEEDLIKESLGLSTLPPKKESKTNSLISLGNVLWMPIVIIFLSFVGFAWFFVFLFMLLGILAPLLDVAMFGLAIFELVTRASEGIEFILFAVGAIILALGLFYPSILLLKLTLKETNNVWKYAKDKTKVVVKKLLGK